MKRSVVVGYDQTPESARALDEAAAEAVRRGAVLTVVHAFPRATSVTHPDADSSLQRTARIAALWIAGRGAERARSRHRRLDARAHACTGSVPTVLAEAASDADLLVVGCGGRDGLAGRTLGSVTARIAARPACPIMVVRSGGHDEPEGTVLAAVDIDDPAEQVLAFAFGEARLRRTGLKAISVREAFWPPVYAGDVGGLRAASIQAEDNAELALEELLKPWQGEYPDVHVRHELAEGPPNVILTAASSHADLVVAGAHRDSGGEPAVRDPQVGPVICTLLLRADCPVVVVPRG